MILPKSCIFLSPIWWKVSVSGWRQCLCAKILNVKKGFVDLMYPSSAHCYLTVYILLGRGRGKMPSYLREFGCEINFYLFKLLSSGLLFPQILLWVNWPKKYSEISPSAHIHKSCPLLEIKYPFKQHYYSTVWMCDKFYRQKFTSKQHKNLKPI